MSVPMKKRRINKLAHFVWNGDNYAVPINVIRKYKISYKTDQVKVSMKDIFGDLIAKSSKPAVLLRGLRHREGISQVEFAKKIQITQTNLSAMENGRRNIGKEVAKRIEKNFGMDYRIFL